MPPGAWATAIWLLASLAPPSDALTTFGGKPITQTNPAPPKPTGPPGRECFRQADCSGIKDTSCVKSPGDTKMRCLCGNDESPINGKCESMAKGLRHSCKDNKDCTVITGLICATPNVTKINSNNKMPPTKICVCNYEEDLVEKDHYCSHGVSFIPLISLIVLATTATSWLGKFI